MVTRPRTRARAVCACAVVLASAACSPTQRVLGTGGSGGAGTNASTSSSGKSSAASSSGSSSAKASSTATASTSGTGGGTTGVGGAGGAGGATSSSGSGGSCAAACPTISGLLAYYPLDTDTLDHSGNGHDATGSNIVPAQGKVCGGYAFDGATSSLNPTGDATMLGGARSLCAWVDWMDPGAASELGQPIFSGGPAFSGDFFSISPSSPKSGLPPAYVPFIDHWGSAGSVGTGIMLPPGAWHFVCYVYDGTGNVTFYGDGTPVTTSGAEYNYTLGTLFMGSQNIGGTSTEPSLLGNLDEVTVWSRALDATELASLWNGGAGCAAR